MAAPPNGANIKVYSDTHDQTIRGTPVNPNTFFIARDVIQGTDPKNILTPEGNIFLVGGTNVEIDLSGDFGTIKDDLQKTISILQIPVPFNSQDTKPQKTQVIDLKRVNNSLTLDGYLSDDAGNITGTGEGFGSAVPNTADGKKKVLKAMAAQGGVIRIYARNEAFVCHIQKINVADDEEDHLKQAGSQGMEAKRKLTVQFIVSEDL